MEAADVPNITASELSVTEKAQRLNAVFGSLRAEYFRDELFELFTHPAYFPELLDRGPCLLVGGRGTGKTTVLKTLTYEGQAHFNTSRPVSDWDFVGLYWRVDTSIVRAFEGEELSEVRWTRLFAHYVNLTLSGLILDFHEWYESRSACPLEVSKKSLEMAARSLGIPGVTETIDLKSGIESALLDLETTINNLGREGEASPTISASGRPVQYLIEAINADKTLRGKTYYFLIDEYENLSNYQQRLMNTLIKHAGDHPYTFKVGMREMGHRERSTINPDEQLIAPADYKYIDISERFDDASFSNFARQVCESRLERLRQEFPVLDTVDELFPSLSEEAEAEKLGVDNLNERTRAELSSLGASEDELASFDSLSPLSAYLVKYWAESKRIDSLTVLREALTYSERWNTRLSNYQHAMLYTIRRGKRGFRKYYSGWPTFTKLADGNIRYLLQLVHEALQTHLRSRPDALAVPVAAEVQTESAGVIGALVVRQLQGVSANSARLTRLVLGLGRIFQVMAAQPEGHSPEVSQFRLSSTPDDASEDLLRAAVMHLAVRRFATDKMAAVSGQTRDFSYQLHPIFAPFFIFSYRSKRRMDLTPQELNGLVDSPAATISSILRKSNRSVEEELPPQLMLFSGYYNDPD
ncbi:hypothetical protein [Mycobacterium sp. SMC-4]|uniref:ORC-CDC6 family AAA ATPase n=1 Tax=Mycobacterium sp. SMC-4 TaxID=2857059 RepID=UPI0021B418CB|nr:hypothetical protein [Mycobacterium sp. SMC-4]UXA17254.1 hypothetical protein KXD98_21310 [Mycobacterium sp. SMC-4]